MTALASTHGPVPDGDENSTAWVMRELTAAPAAALRPRPSAFSWVASRSNISMACSRGGIQGIGLIGELDGCHGPAQGLPAPIVGDPMTETPAHDAHRVVTGPTKTGGNHGAAKVVATAGDGRFGRHGLHRRTEHRAGEQVGNFRSNSKRHGHTPAARRSAARRDPGTSIVDGGGDGPAPTWSLSVPAVVNLRVPTGRDPTPRHDVDRAVADLSNSTSSPTVRWTETCAGPRGRRAGSGGPGAVAMPGRSGRWRSWRNGTTGGGQWLGLVL